MNFLELKSSLLRLPPCYQKERALSPVIFNLNQHQAQGAKLTMQHCKKNRLLVFIACSVFVHFFVAYRLIFFPITKDTDNQPNPKKPTKITVSIQTHPKNGILSKNSESTNIPLHTNAKKNVSKKHHKVSQSRSMNKKHKPSQIKKNTKKQHTITNKMETSNPTSQNIDMTLPKDFLIDSQEKLPDIFDPKLRQRLKEARAAKHKNSLGNEASDFYMQGRDRVYIQDHNCYEEKRNDGELNGQGFWLPQRCSWIKTESDKMMEGVNDAMKNTNSAPFIP